MRRKQIDGQGRDPMDVLKLRKKRIEEDLDAVLLDKKNFVERFKGTEQVQPLFIRRIDQLRAQLLEIERLIYREKQKRLGAHA